jgi:hypothetical protein
VRTAPGDARGASLASVLVVIVVLGAVTAGAIIGVDAMTGNDTPTTSLSNTSTTAGSAKGGGSSGSGLGSAAAQAAAAACKANATAATAASAVHFANTGGTYPTKWSDLTASTPPNFELSPHTVINPRDPAELDGNGWKLILSGGGATAPSFACK